VVTGVGVVTPVGSTVDAVGAALARARGAAAVVPELAADDVPVSIAATVGELPQVPGVTARVLRYCSRSTRFALAAAAAAVTDSGLDGSVLLRGAGVAVGVGSAGTPSMEEAVRDAAGVPAHTTAFLVPRAMPNSPAAAVALHLAAQGPALTYATACASGSTAIGEGFRKIQHGEVDVMVVGGTDAPVTSHIMTGMARLGVMSPNTADPAGACRPFDADRDGLVLGEGAAFLVLEAESVAAARGAVVRGHVLGYGSTCDAYHRIAPEPSGSGGAQAIERALLDAGLSPWEIGHINGHGTGTRAGDESEARTYGKVFGAACPPVTACKGVTGHMFGAAGAFEAVVALECARAATVPPVANLVRTDLDIDVVTAAPRRITTAPVLSHSYGFGGHNSSLVLSPVAEEETCGF
jgi:3-oxoacyl-[acyl-carrier-protein] synthase II